MSDSFFKPEVRSVPDGAEFPDQVLSGDGEQKSRSGFVGQQNQHKDAIGRGQEVNLGSAPSPVSPNNANGAANRPFGDMTALGVAGRDVSVKHVDQKCIEGSYPGDSRAKGSPAVLPPNPAPRAGMTQARLTSKLDTPPVASFPDVVD